MFYNVYIFRKLLVNILCNFSIEFVRSFSILYSSLFPLVLFYFILFFLCVCFRPFTLALLTVYPVPNRHQRRDGRNFTGATATALKYTDAYSLRYALLFKYLVRLANINIALTLV